VPNLAKGMILTDVDQLWVADITFLHLSVSRLRTVITTSKRWVLRRPIETAQYACGAYSELLNLHGIQSSMSRVGNPYDNAEAESFMNTLKQEEVQGIAYKDIDEARRRTGAFIDTVYNKQRLHSALDYL